MRNFTFTTIALGIFASMAMTSLAQTTPQLELPKIVEPDHITVDPSSPVGRIFAENKRGKKPQYLEEWENKSNQPNVITYVLIGDDGTAFTATWGKGPINPKAFRCKPDKFPEFGEKVFWVATEQKGKLMFQEIKDDNIKHLFENVSEILRTWRSEVNAKYKWLRVNNMQLNILNFMKEKNRKKWYEQGWLQLANRCVLHF